uniref:Uncharacterized protein AlNc14C398G11344 n=1 Tax=Albugo laibachii Nc14 TaxID=890382 RepID=F0WYT4_9STRA|nr:conserved hypothetical protein [Albugo laibachii Nc14]|eukprot:CCA26643.1 conserved hypothetical protein [Albugo laibachii Nc14]
MTMLVAPINHMNFYGIPKSNYMDLGATLTKSNAQRPFLLQHPVSLSVSSYQNPEDDNGYAYLGMDNDNMQTVTKSALYKTELCKRFSEFGVCRYGVKCQFAHGHSELRQIIRHPKYKTTKCKSYWGSGHCPYGNRCRFIHEDNEVYSKPVYDSAQDSIAQTPTVSVDEQPAVSNVVDSILYLHESRSLHDVIYREPSIMINTSFPSTIWRASSSPSTFSGALPLSDTESDSSSDSENDDPLFPDLDAAIDALVQLAVSDENVSEVVDQKLKSKNQKTEALPDLEELWGEFVSSTKEEIKWSLEHSDFVSDVESFSLENKQSSPRLRIFESFH